MNNVMMRGSFCLFGLAALCAFAAEGPETNRFEMLYEKWHAALRAHPFLTPPMFFLTEGVPQDLASVVREIERDKLGMALYLCEKIAARENMDGRLFFDVRLLDEVSGVNLWYSERPTEKGGDVIAELTARFRDEWRQGLYKDPSSKVAQLCLEKFPEQASEEIGRASCRERV